jgi:hypothetical protein
MSLTGTPATVAEHHRSTRRLAVLPDHHRVDGGWVDTQLAADVHA